jgi:hypothetical protein
VRSSGARLPARVGPVLQQSLLALPDDAQRVVSGMALAGPDVPLPLLVSVLDLPTTEVVTGIDAAVEAEVLVRRPLGTIAFRHALLAEAAEALLDATAGRDLHHRLGRAWDAVDGEAASACGGTSPSPFRSSPTRRWRTGFGRSRPGRCGAVIRPVRPSCWSWP